MIANLAAEVARLNGLICSLSGSVEATSSTVVAPVARSDMRRPASSKTEAIRTWPATDDVRQALPMPPNAEPSTDSASVQLDDADTPCTAEHSGHRFPALDLLDDPEGNYSEKAAQVALDQALVLTKTLSTYGINGEISGIECGPMVTFYSVELEAGTRVARLETIARDIARALTAPNVRIIPSIAGSTAVGIEVPNKVRETVRLKELMSGGQTANMMLPMFMGKDSSGEPLVLDLAKMPHMLVAGATGSGVSVCLHAVLLSLLRTKSPDELQLVLVDPAMAQLTAYAGLPHLTHPVVTSDTGVAAILDWVATMVEERYGVLRQAGVRDIRAFNALSDDDLRARMNVVDGPLRTRMMKRMPRLVVVIAELADLDPSERSVEESILRIARRSGAAGIHLVLATEHPDASILTRRLKSYIPCRVAFRLASEEESRIVMDRAGGETLLGRGDMLLVTPGRNDAVRCQGALVADREVRAVVEALQLPAATACDLRLLVERTENDLGEAVRRTEGDAATDTDLASIRRLDPLFDAAAELIINSGRGSVSLLQRRLALGYGRASRLVDLMHRAGLLGEPQGSHPREVAVTMEEWHRMKRCCDDTEGSFGLSDEELRVKLARLAVKMNTKSASTQLRDADIPGTPDYSGYKFPTLELLDGPEGNYSEKAAQVAQDQALVLTKTLNTYGINGEISGIECGPVVTVYSVELEAGTRVARLETIAKDIARALTAPNVRIIPNMAGSTAVGIEVPNKVKEKVRLKELMSGGHAQGMMLPMFMGKDSSGEPLVLDLAKMPHMLIAGTTGSGKSVCMNTIIMSFLYTKRPDELKLVLVDPKMVEMALFAEIPHLACPVVTDMAIAGAILSWAVEKMEERYELLKEAGVRDIKSFNAMGEEELRAQMNITDDAEWARVPKKLPYMVFVIDELADLMMTTTEDDVETSIVRIAQKARAVGIHLILATQRPQATVVTGLIKSNMPCRVAFKVASGTDSRIVLDQKGAELLLGQGDMLVVTPSQTDARRCQGTLVDDRETRGVVKFLKSVATQDFERQLITIRASSKSGSDDATGGAMNAHKEDALFDKAVEIMIESGRGSVSLLQRRLSIGYGRASRLVDMMGQAELLGEHKGSQAREVNVSMEEWHRMKAMRDGAEREGTVFERPGDAGDDDALRMHDEEGY